MDDPQFRRKVYGFLTLCIAILTLIGLVIPFTFNVAHDEYYGNYWVSNSIGLGFLGFHSKYWLAILAGTISWLQLIFSAGAIALVVLSFFKLEKHSTLINKTVTLGGVAFTGVHFFLGLITIIYNCVEAGSDLSHYMFTSFSFIPFGLTLALLFFMAKLDKKYRRQSPSVVKSETVSDMEKITEFKKMLDADILTQEEFDELKTKILYGEGLQK